MYTSTVMSLAPSMKAESSNSWGTVWKKVRMMIRFHTEIATGTTSAQMVLYMPRLRTSR